MSLGRKLAAYGLLAMIGAGLAWLWMLCTQKQAERSVCKRHPSDPWGM